MIEEKRDLILGLQLCENCVQLTYYNNTMKEPATLSADGEKDSYLFPVKPEEWAAATEKEKPNRELKELFSRCLDRVKTLGKMEDIRIMVTVPELVSPLDERIPGTLEEMGIERKYIFLQDYKSSFYYYTVNQKRELWSGDVALLEYEEDTMNGYVLHVDKSTKPALVTVEKAASQKMDESARDGRPEEEWNRERDRLFFELLKKVFERRNVTTSYLMGDYLDRKSVV